jgi:hypothetical protein
MKQPRKTPTKEQKQWLKDNGYTAEQMDNFWRENVGTNPVITNLDKHGMTWRDMNLCILNQLPTQKERDIKAMEEKKRQEEERVAEELRKKQEKEYYNTHFEEILLQKIDRGEPLTERELSTLVCEYDIDTEYGDNRRWSRTVTTIVQLGDRHFSIDWEQGLTECQENEFYNQPVEVVGKLITKTIMVTEWVPIKESGSNGENNSVETIPCKAIPVPHA